MNETNLLNQILQNTYTKASFLKRIRLLREFLEFRFFTKDQSKLSDFLKKEKAPPEDQRALLDIKDEVLNSLIPENLYPTLNKMTEDINSIPTITIYIPIDSRPSDIEKLGLWFRKNVSVAALLDARFDQKRIGGCAIVAHNTYRDFSLHHFITKKRDAILNIMNKYADRN